MDLLNDLLVAADSPIREALAQIDRNQQGLVLATNASLEVVGLATDGDIRRALLRGLTLDDQVADCMNREFYWVPINTAHETILKHLDQSIRLIPILDSAHRLHAVVSRDHLPTRIEGRIYARARAPVRISFGGGGSDLTHFFADEQGAVINTTISLYSHATIRLRDDKRIVVHSLDLGQRLEAENIDSAIAQSGKFGLIQALLRVVRPEFGFDLFLHSDFPVGSGLGGSAAVSSAVLGCLNVFRRDRWDNHELAEIAFQAERLHLGIAGGWQDQYATVFGGFNFMEFRMEQNIVHPLRVHPDILLELEESLVLCDTGVSHHSGEIHQDQRKTMQANDIKQLVQANVALTYTMRNHLLRGRLIDFGRLLNDSWQIKRQLSAKISNDNIDSIYLGALTQGAVGGKLLGAGGGGFFVFFTQPFLRNELVQYLQSKSLKVQSFRFEPDGLQSWSSRERGASSAEGIR
jgi:D-glycero-alpha-D-manno-heptose-7-phosphate kinase